MDDLTQEEFETYNTLKAEAFLEECHALEKELPGFKTWDVLNYRQQNPQVHDPREIYERLQGTYEEPVIEPSFESKLQQNLNKENKGPAEPEIHNPFDKVLEEGNHKIDRTLPVKIYEEKGHKHPISFNEGAQNE